MKAKIAIMGVCIISSCSYAKNDQDFDSIMKCQGNNTEYTLVDNSLYVQPDGGCFYNKKTNKIGNAIAYIISNDESEKISIPYNKFKKGSKEFIFLIPKEELLEDKNSENGFYVGDRFIIKMYEKKNKEWRFIRDFKVNNNSMTIYKEIENIMLYHVISLSNLYNIKDKFNMDVNHDGVLDTIEIIKKKSIVNSIVVISGKDNSILYMNRNIFNSSFNECNYSSFNNISVSKNNFTLEYSTCTGNSEIGHRYSTFRTESNREPILIQDNYLIYPQAETPVNFKPRKVNCMTKEKITFSQYNGRCG